MGATEQFAVHIAGGHCFIPETKIGTHLAQIHGSGHLSHYDARGAAVIFHSSASTAATFDRGSLASQSRLLTFSLSLLLSVFFSTAALSVQILCVEYILFRIPLRVYPILPSALRTRTHTYKHLYRCTVTHKHDHRQRCNLLCNFFLLHTPCSAVQRN